jgi:uncharacterized lipoprotein YajG
MKYLIIAALLLLASCSHGPWIVDVSKCDPGPSSIKLCHKVQEVE